MTVGAFALVNNKIVPFEKAALPLNDLGFVRGWAVCEVLESRRHFLFHFDDHWARMEFSLKWAEIPSKLWPNKEKLRRNLEKLALLCNFFESLIFVYVTSGISQDGWNPVGKACVYAFVIQEKRKVRPVKMHTVKFKRSLPGIKSPYYLPGEIFYKEARFAGYDDALFVDPASGELLETTRSNLVIVEKGGVLRTQMLDSAYGKVLSGVTIKILLKLAQENEPRFYVDFNQMTMRELFTKNQRGLISGAILTSTSGVVPVSEIEYVELEAGQEVLDLCGLFARYREEYFSKRGC